MFKTAWSKCGKIELMNIHQLKVFVSVFKNRSFSKASETLYLSQPTVSDHIKTLEEELDCRLFDRLGRTILPTKEAEALYSHALELIEKADAIKEAVGRFKKEISGEIVIGASTIPGTYLMPRIIADFRKKNPSVSFRILIGDSKEIIEKVAGHECIMGIAGAKLNDAGIDYKPFMEDELIAVASPSLIEAGTIAINELAKYPMVLREEGSGTRRETETIFEKHNIRIEDIRIACIFGSTDSVKQAVKAGLGFAVLSKLSVRDELKYKALKEIRLKSIQMKRMFYIVTHKKRTLPVAYRMFSDHLKSYKL